MSTRQTRWRPLVGPSVVSTVWRSSAHGILIVLFAALLSLPSLLVGIPPGYDSDYHTAYQYHFSRQFWEGDLYPRWLTGANKGYGSPIFLIQYPLPYFGTALLRPLTAFTPSDVREARELGMFCFLAFAGAGLAARAWFRRRCAPAAATLAAALYISLPHVLGQALYLRTGLGELSALVWMPLLLALCDAALSRFVGVCALAGVFALLLVTHATSAVLFLPLLIGYALVADRSASSSSTRAVTSIALGVALGTGLAAVYVLPFLAYRSLFDLKTMASIFPSFELGRWFPYVTSDSLTRRFVLWGIAGAIAFASVTAFSAWRARGGLVSRVVMVATLGLGVVVMIPDLGPRLIRASGLHVSSFETAGDFSTRMLLTSVLTVALGFLAYCRLSTTVTRREQLLLVVVCGAFMLMLPWSAVLWTTDVLGNIQFPFRLGGVLTLAVAGLFAAALNTGFEGRRDRDCRWSLITLGLAALVVIGAGALAWRVPERFRNPDTARAAIAHNVDNMFRSYVSPQHVAALSKRLGTSPDSFEVALTPVDEHTRGEVIRAEVTQGHCTAGVTPGSPGVLGVSTRCHEHGRVEIGQLYSPLWRVLPAAHGPGQPVLGSSADGLIEVALSAGQHDFELVFDGRWPEQAGVVVTLVSLAIAAGGPAVVGLRSWARTSTVTTPTGDSRL